MTLLNWPTPRVFEAGCEADLAADLAAYAALPPCPPYPYWAATLRPGVSAEQAERDLEVIELYGRARAQLLRWRHVAPGLPPHPPPLSGALQALVREWHRAVASPQIGDRW